MFRELLAAALALLLIAPVAFAGGQYTHETTMKIHYGTPVFSDAHVYVVDLAAGDVVSAVVSWSDPLTDLDLELRRPMPPCSVYPDPQPTCWGDSVDTTCENGRGRIAFGPASEQMTFVAEADGAHEVIIRTGFSAATKVPYRIEISIDGAGGDVTGPFAAIFRLNSPACKAQPS